MPLSNDFLPSIFSCLYLWLHFIVFQPGYLYAFPPVASYPGPAAGAYLAPVGVPPGVPPGPPPSHGSVCPGATYPPNGFHAGPYGGPHGGPNTIQYNIIQCNPVQYNYNINYCSLPMGAFE